MNTNIIGLHGPKRSGKTTIASHMAKMLIQQHHKQVILLGFADALKESIAKMLKIELGAIDENKTLFRPMLQWLGTDYYRNVVDKDYWVKKWIEKARNIQSFLPGVVIIAHDVRFENEVDAITRHGGQVFRVCDINNPNAERDDHESEKRLEIEMPIISNDFKDFSKTKEQIEQLIKII